MSNQNLEVLIGDLKSGEPERQVLALEQAKKFSEEVARVAVGAMRTSPEPFLIAERLHWLGSKCVEPLQQVLQDSPSSSEEAILASLVLLQLGLQDGKDILLCAVRSGSEYAGLAARHLSSSRVVEAKEAILERLRECDTRGFDEIISLVTALRDLGGELPGFLKDRFSNESVAWQLRTLVE